MSESFINLYFSLVYSLVYIVYIVYIGHICPFVNPLCRFETFPFRFVYACSHVLDVCVCAKVCVYACIRYVALSHTWLCFFVCFVWDMLLILFVTVCYCLLLFVFILFQIPLFPSRFEGDVIFLFDFISHVLYLFLHHSVQNCLCYRYCACPYDIVRL
jgi:hypothetical protein